MLLAEISFTTPQPVVAPDEYNFAVANNRLGPNPFRNWIESIATFPHTSYADMDTVAAMDRILTTETDLYSVTFGLVNGPYQPSRTNPLEQFYIDRAFDGYYAERGLIATRYAPPIGPTYALQSYDLTAIERHVTPTMQTIRIYGFAVPEPATCLILVLGALLQVNMCRSCSARGRRHHGCLRVLHVVHSRQ
jgi:hypothetical protein